MTNTNFDLYLKEQLKDPAFVERFEKAGLAWDVALQILPNNPSASAGARRRANP
jgi:hypothetical protein